MIFACRRCRAESDLDVTDEQMRRWISGEMIQNVMPHLTADERELIMSFICGKCFNEMFRNDG